MTAQEAALHAEQYRAARDELFKNDGHLDPRCNCSLYEELLEAALLVQQNRYEAAREKVLSAFGIIRGTV